MFKVSISIKSKSRLIDSGDIVHSRKSHSNANANVDASANAGGGGISAKNNITPVICVADGVGEWVEI